MERYLLNKTALRLTRILFMAAAMIACTAQSLPVWAQSARLIAAFRQYQSLEKQGKYAEAIPYAQTVIKLAEEEFGESHQHVAIGLNNLAQLYRAQGRYDEVEPLVKRALAIDEKNTYLIDTSSTLRGA